jgi:cation transport ATPase
MSGDAFDLRASRRSEESTYAGIVPLVEDAQRSKAPMSRLAVMARGWTDVPSSWVAWIS